jgi:putative transposase
MKYDPDRNHRRSIRLEGYDYTQTCAYFVTICTRDRECLFDDPVLRRVAETCWLDVPRHFPKVALDEWVLMPNHFHGILVLGEAFPCRWSGGQFRPMNVGGGVNEIALGNASPSTRMP